VGQLVYNETTIPCEMPHEGIFSWGGSWDINYNLILGGLGRSTARLYDLRNERLFDSFPLRQLTVFL